MELWLWEKGWDRIHRVGGAVAGERGVDHGGVGVAVTRRGYR